MSRAENTIIEAQAFLGDDLELTRLDQIFDLQRLLGPVIAYKVLLGIAINSADPKEQRLAASQLLTASGEEPARVAERLRASIFRDLTLSQLEAVIQTGITDPQAAIDALQGNGYIEEALEEVSLGTSATQS
jgi:hypothetical protein